MGQVTVGKYRAIEITVDKSLYRIGIWKVLWGTDIFINNLPIIKLLITANVIVWAIFLFKG
jgi:hypothetical protein